MVCVDEGDARLKRLEEVECITGPPELLQRPYRGQTGQTQVEGSSMADLAGRAAASKAFADLAGRAVASTLFADRLLLQTSAAGLAAGTSAAGLAILVGLAAAVEPTSTSFADRAVLAAGTSWAGPIHPVHAGDAWLVRPQPAAFSSS